jgi:hypothetical protein
MNVTIDWGALGEVFLVSFGAAVGVIVLFTFGVSALAAPTTEPTSMSGETARTAPRNAAVRPWRCSASWPAPWWSATAST